ncbi:UPF0149 family protein [Candidatus Aalborgicola defluviihabitans]|uniref:UPF0149 family protein n=1 Tax=Candidatus Aalborgicola defluviihabitans TaxID=3386187 RepID=UPI00390BFAA7|nr:UPF0149 family protein [Burkholderiales bacterium]
MMTTPNPNPSSTPSVTADQFDNIDAILDDLRTRYDETPQWEFCEGFMAALICCRRPIPQSEYLDVLLAIGDDTLPAVVAAEGTPDDAGGSFADAAQREQFLHIWNQRWAEIQTALDTPTESLEGEAAYHPEVMDVRGAVAALSETERAEMADDPLPSFGQVWALGFMFVVEAWPDEWVPPSDKKAAKWHDVAMQAIVALTEDDEGEPELSPFDDDGPPSMSADRLNAFADAVWSVYDLREIWRGIGPRVETVRRADVPGRNDPCYCGSGKKYKKCHGA